MRSTQKAWRNTRGANGDFNKSAFAAVHRRLCECGEYRGFSIVYSGRRSLHFHFLFDTKHLVNAPWDADALKRVELQRETAALMRNVHDGYWDHTGNCIDEILRPSRCRDRSMKSFTKWRRMPWGVRVIEDQKECQFLNLTPGDIVPQLVIYENILEKASKNSELLLPPTFSTSHPSKTKSPHHPATANEFGGDQTEVILLMQELCLHEWGSEFPKPIRVDYQAGGPCIKFQNYPADKNASSYVLGDHRKLVIQGNAGPAANLYLPDHMNASEFVEFTLRRSGMITNHDAASKVPARSGSANRAKPEQSPAEKMVMRRFNNQRIYASKAETQNRERDLLKQSIGELRDFNMSYLIKSAEGFGKTTSHFLPIENEMFDIALDQCGHDSSSPRFGCFAFRSYEQAEQKADEFRSMSLRRCAAVIKSLNVIYCEFCEQENETPIGKDEADEPTLSSYLAEIASKQPGSSQSLRIIGRDSGPITSSMAEPSYLQRMPSSKPGKKTSPPGYGFIRNSTLSTQIRRENSRIRSLSIKWFLTSSKSTNLLMFCLPNCLSKSKRPRRPIAIGEA